MKINDDGVVVCDDSQLRAIKKDLSSVKKDFNDQPHNYYNYDLVRPYTVSLPQRRQLESLLGKKDVSQLETLNSLIYSGIIDTSCPEGHHKYIDNLTGQTQCKRPIKRVIQYTGVTKCPDPMGDPLAIEHYVDAMGDGKCRRPVLRGKFQCDDPSQEHVTLPDGTGICVRSKESLDREFFIPDHVVYPGRIFNQVKAFENLFNGFGLNRMQVRDLNRVLLNSKNVRDLRPIVNKTFSDAFGDELLRHIVQSGDIPAANHGLFNYASKLRDMWGYGQPTTGEFLRMMGIPTTMLGSGQKGGDGKSSGRKNGKKKGKKRGKKSSGRKKSTGKRKNGKKKGKKRGKKSSGKRKKSSPSRRKSSGKRKKWMIEWINWAFGKLF